MNTVRFQVTGRVQGVGFRVFTQRAARHQGVVGWVRNLPDGTVEGWAQGDDGSIHRLLTALENGPPAAHVEGLTVQTKDPIDAVDFRIVR